MLLTIAATRFPDGSPATDLGYLLHKNPARVQTFEQSFGHVHVFYPQADEQRCQVAVLLDVDPVALVRRGGSMRGQRGLDQYVNDRPYVASSFLSVAMNGLFATAMNGRCKERPQLVQCATTLAARIAVVSCRGGEAMIRSLFEPLGYEVQITAHPLDEAFPEWGEGHVSSVELKQTTTLQSLLQHLYILIPVLDNDKHYWVGEDEVEKLLVRGKDWLKEHPHREFITTRYLKYQSRLSRDALARLTEGENDLDPDAAQAEHAAEEEAIERPLSLNQQRLGSVVSALKGTGAASVLDLGCGEGNLLRLLLQDKQFTRIVGVDVSLGSLQRAAERLRFERMAEHLRQRIDLRHGSLIYRDDRLSGFDAAAIVEVIEHLDPPRLQAFERAVFEFARPRTVVITTPNREYNVRWETLPAGAFRHRDHRFEWTRDQFQHWAGRVANEHGYRVHFLPVGPEDAEVGSPTQMGVFERDAHSAFHSGSEAVR